MRRHFLHWADVAGHAGVLAMWPRRLQFGQVDSAAGHFPVSWVRVQDGQGVDGRWGPSWRPLCCLSFLYADTARAWAPGLCMAEEALVAAS